MSGRLAVLFRLSGRGAVQKLLLPLLALGVLVAPMLAVEWNGSTLMLWGVSFPDTGAQGRDGALGGYLRELLSWWWMGIGLAYMLPVILMASAGSFSRDQVLWLRMTPCSARELALARVWRVLAPLSLLGAGGFCVAFGVAWYHQVSPRAAAFTVAEMLAHGIWSAGIVLLIGPLLRAPVDRALCSFVAFLTPVMAFLVFIALQPRLSETLKVWWPYTIPFARLAADPKTHLLSSTAIGAGAMFVSVLLQPGHRRSSNAPTLGN